MSVKNTVERDKKIVRLYGEGAPSTELAELYGVSRQRIDQILKRNGAVDPAEARATRAKLRELAQQDMVSTFLSDYGSLLNRLANLHASRSDVERKFAVLEPDISPETVRAAIKSSGVLFDVNREEVNFGTTVIEAGIWYIIANVNNLQGDIPTAFEEVTLDEMLEVENLTETAGLEPATVKSIIVSMAFCRKQLLQDSNLTITKKRYDEEREKVLRQFRKSSGSRALDWPPTSQTITKRLGGGYWNDALASIGVVASTQGRPRGLLIFDEEQYLDAIQDFKQHCAATTTAASYSAFEVWVRHEDRAGRQRPSGPSVRKFFGSWMNAKRSSSLLLLKTSAESSTVTQAASIARTALHDAITSRRSSLEQLSALPIAQRPAVAAAFVRDYMAEFEVRRRQWLRSMIVNDADAALRFLNNGQPSRAHRDLLSFSPPQIEEILKDMYLDRMLSADTGVRNSGGWLHPDAQAQLDSIPEAQVLASRVLREVKNLLTHESTESEARLTSAIKALANLEEGFIIERRLTRRVLSSWLLRDDSRRLDYLSESIVFAWRSMLAAEAVQDV